MKKLISILLLICTLTFCLASCGGKDTNDDNTNSDNSSNNQTEQENHTSYDAFTFYPQSSDTYVVGIAPEGKYYTEIVIPSTYNGGKVVGIVKEGFKDCESLTSIKIPNTVTEIKESAFYGCKNLKTIELSNSVTKIEKDAFKPEKKGQFSMYLEGEWYLCEINDELKKISDPVASLDVSLLQDYLLAPVLGIGDPRTDKRIDFVGGIRGLAELEKRANGDMKVSFAMYPTGITELFDVADNGMLMPPKSTWFEPKLRSGVFIHRLS